MYSWPVELNVHRHIRCRFVRNFRDFNIVVLSIISEQHLNSVGVRRRIDLNIVETLSVYFT